MGNCGALATLAGQSLAGEPWRAGGVRLAALEL